MITKIKLDAITVGLFRVSLAQVKLEKCQLALSSAETVNELLMKHVIMEIKQDAQRTANQIVDLYALVS